MNCPKCKNPIEDNATICEWCGSNIKIETKNSLSDLNQELLSMSQNKLAAVKFYHEKTGSGLKQAKDYVDNLFAKNFPNNYIQGNKKGGCFSIILILFIAGTVASVITSFIL